MTSKYLSDGGWIELVCTLAPHEGKLHYDEAFSLSWSWSYDEADA
jgi:hypothetical protein